MHHLKRVILPVGGKIIFTNGISLFSFLSPLLTLLWFLPFSLRPGEEEEYTDGINFIFHKDRMHDIKAKTHASDFIGYKYFQIGPIMNETFTIGHFHEFCFSISHLCHIHGASAQISAALNFLG